MNQQPQRSESGAPIYRHEARSSGFELASGDEQSIKSIGHHVERFVGAAATVYHELVSDLVHVDIHMVEPSPDRNHYTLVTSGMSDRPMTAPEARQDCRYAELVMCLPPTWPLADEAFKDESNYWPIRWLKTLARLPHEYNTWLHATHTVPNGDPPTPFARNTALCCALLLRPALFQQEFRTLVISPEKTIHFLSFVPIYREEMDFKLSKGLDALVDRLDAAGVTELLDIRRANVCKKRLGLF